MTDFSETNATVADLYPGIDVSKFSYLDLTEKFVCVDYDGPRYVIHESSPGNLGDLKTPNRTMRPRCPEPEYSDLEIGGTDHEVTREQVSLMDGSDR